ncbi:carboxypeptidase-like regulatory domain-containing protein [Bizionia arctica]|uniref:Carboxypeptidase-like regulatory domain-containing protein n=1 Tax=Bizionia arctica TaxID=1495645 RepID=A0A917LLX2_9FLAO|nr:carboxypeptidase-like regulatory domain-containing protein [Bizionia arctica]GGG41456.1 hypothetical protein GCM10010976_11330 [Bizionia arctica]
MNRIFKSLLIFSCSITFSQTGSIEGKSVFKKDNSILPGTIVTLSNTTYGTISDIEGNFKFSELPIGKYDLLFEFLGYGKDTLSNIEVKENELTKLIIALPPGECFEKEIPNLCPIDSKSKSVIPIVYGLPNAKTMAKKKKGKVKLGGCEITGCEPYWFCKEHEIEF